MTCDFCGRPTDKLKVMNTHENIAIYLCPDCFEQQKQTPGVITTYA